MLQINITPEQIDQLVRDKIMEAALGKNIQAMINKILSPNSYNNPVEEVLKQTLAAIVRDLLEKDYRPQLEAAVREEIDKRVTAEVVAKYADAAITKVVRAAEDR